MVARSRIDKLERDIEALHATRTIPPLVDALKTLSTQQLRDLERALTKDPRNEQ